MGLLLPNPLRKVTDIYVFHKTCVVYILFMIPDMSCYLLLHCENNLGLCIHWKDQIYSLHPQRYKRNGGMLLMKSQLNSYQSYDEESDYGEADDWLWNFITFTKIAKNVEKPHQSAKRV
jgi:hypothetical protein